MCHFLEKKTNFKTILAGSKSMVLQYGLVALKCRSDCRRCVVDRTSWSLIIGQVTCVEIPSLFQLPSGRRYMNNWYSYFSPINKPTRVNKNTATLIDHIYTNSNNNTGILSLILYTGIYDDSPILQCEKKIYMSHLFKVNVEFSVREIWIVLYPNCLKLNGLRSHRTMHVRMHIKKSW